MATYLGEKLHTNVQLPAILPGARGAALLWQGAAAATGLVLGAGQVYGGAAPFGLAFTMVCPPLYLFAAAGGVLISSLAFQPAVLGVKVIAALTATVAVRRLLQDKPNTKTRASGPGVWRWRWPRRPYFFSRAATSTCPRRRPPAPRRCWRRGLPG